MTAAVPPDWHPATDPPPEGEPVLVLFADDLVHVAHREGDRYQLPPADLGRGPVAVAWKRIEIREGLVARFSVPGQMREPLYPEKSL